MWLQIEFLEVRLSEVMAYADIPPSMRPALTEFDAVAALTGQGGNNPLAGLLGNKWVMDGHVNLCL